MFSPIHFTHEKRPKSSFLIKISVQKIVIFYRYNLCTNSKIGDLLIANGVHSSILPKYALIQSLFIFFTSVRPFYPQRILMTTSNGLGTKNWVSGIKSIRIQGRNTNSFSYLMIKKNAQLRKIHFFKELPRQKTRVWDPSFMTTQMRHFYYL